MEEDKYYLVKNVRLLNVKENETKNCDILFLGPSKTVRSKILEIGNGFQVPEDRPVKLKMAGSRLCSRAFVDTACYLPNRGGGRQGEIYAQTVRAAQSGGFGTVLLLPSAGNPMDTPAAVAAMKRDCRAYDVELLPTASVAISERGKYKLTDFAEMKKAGAVALAVPEKRKLPAEMLLEAMYKAAEQDMTLFCSVSGSVFSEKGAVNAGRIAKLLRVPGIPACAELLAVNECLLLAAESGCRVHIPVISLKESVQSIRLAKQAGVRVTCGTAPQYFSLTEDDLIFRGVNAKLDPPLRSAADRAAVVEGLRDGTIDCIASDHRPCTPEEKGNDVATGAFGAVGLETAFAAGFTFLVLSGKLDLLALLYKLTVAPAEILGVNASLAAGQRMDLVMLDEEKEMIYTNNTLRSRACNTPYYGAVLRGAVDDRIIDGK